MKILLIAEFATFGGARTYFEQLLRFYAAASFEVVVAVPASQHDAELADLLRQLSVRLVRLPERGAWGALGHKLPFSIGFDLIATAVVVMEERPDLLVVSATLPPNYLGLVLLPLPFLYIVHTVPVQTSRSRAEKLLMRFFRSPRKRVLTVSNYAKAQITRFWGADAKAVTLVLHNSVEIFPAGRRSAIETAEPDVVRVLTIGHLVAYKNPCAWMRIAESVIREAGCSVEFVWVGDGELRGECEKAAARSGGRIRFLGFRADVDRFYASSHIYLQPSLVESHGLAVVEAMRWSLPCIVAATGGLPESVTENVNGFVVPPHDEAAFARRVLRLVHDPQLRQAMGAAARRLCAERFDQRRWAGEMRRLHDGLTGIDSATTLPYAGTAIPYRTNGFTEVQQENVTAPELPRYQGRTS